MHQHDHHVPGQSLELTPVLTSKGALLKVKGKVHRACVQRVIVYGSETWPAKKENMQRLDRAEKMMVRWMCGASLKKDISSTEFETSVLVWMKLQIL